jgi:hypothetical protein
VGYFTVLSASKLHGVEWWNDEWRIRNDLEVVVD